MSVYIVTFREQASDEDVAQVKQRAQSRGGTIENEFSLIKAFSVSFPEDTYHALDSHPSVDNVEADEEMTTQ